MLEIIQQFKLYIIKQMISGASVKALSNWLEGCELKSLHNQNATAGSLNKTAELSPDATVSRCE